MPGANARRPTTCGQTAHTPVRRNAVSAERAAELALRRSPYGELATVSCHFHEGVLTLNGHVRSYYLKQVAQTLVRQTAGVRRVCNRLHVLASDEALT